MKHLLVVLVTLFLWSCNQNKTATETNLEPDKEAIKAVIENESASFFGRNYDEWKKTYAQTDYAFQAWSNSDGTFDSNVGWEDINKQIGRYITENPAVSHPKIERKNMKFKFYNDDVAYITWDQFNSDKDLKHFLHSKEVRLMEKIAGEWKIVCVSAFWDYKNPIPAERLPMIQKIANERRSGDKL